MVRKQEEQLSSTFTRMKKSLAPKASKKEPAPVDDAQPSLADSEGNEISPECANCDVWLAGNVLRYGDASWKVTRNEPSTTSLQVKQPLVAHFGAQPTFPSEFADAVVICWYNSGSEDEEAEWESTRLPCNSRTKIKTCTDASLQLPSQAPCRLPQTSPSSTSGYNILLNTTADSLRRSTRLRSIWRHSWPLAASGTPTRTLPLGWGARYYGGKANSSSDPNCKWICTKTGAPSSHPTRLPPPTLIPLPPPLLPLILSTPRPRQSSRSLLPLSWLALSWAAATGTAGKRPGQKLRARGERERSLRRSRTGPWTSCTTTACCGQRRGGGRFQTSQSKACASTLRFPARSSVQTMRCWFRSSR